EGFSAASAFATIVMERVLDMLAVLLLLATFVVGHGLAGYSPALQRIVQLTAAAAAGGAVVLLLVSWTLATHPERIGRFVFRTGRILPHRVAETLSRLAQTFSEGFLVVRRPRPLVLALAWSVALWISITVQTWLVTNAFGIAMPYTGTFLLQA